MEKPKNHIDMGIDYCPNCDHLLNSATAVENGEKPKANSLTVCIYCAAVLVYGDDFALRKVTDEDLDSREIETLIYLRNLKRLIESKPCPGHTYRPKP